MTELSTPPTPEESRAHNRKATSSMARDRMNNQRTAANLQMALPKIRQPLGSLMDKGIPFNIEDRKELVECRNLCRLYYRTHDLVPLLIDIYATFPCLGLEFVSKDPLIEKFYSDMFLNELNYEDFLPRSIGREFFTVGEANVLAHFNEQLGIWSSEEILDPNMIRVSKSLFIQQERVQLLVKDLVERLRSGPQGLTDPDESPSERMERTYEYCLVPQTRVLTEELDWIPVGSLRLGDKIIGFDEYAPAGRGQGRCWRQSEITATSIIQAPTFEVKTSAVSVTCTGEHLWLAYPRPALTGRGNNRGKRRGQRGLQWIKTKDLQPGDRIYYIEPWDQDTSFEGGYLSGILDGEGWLSKSDHTNWLGIYQNNGAVLEKFVSILERHKFQLTKEHPQTPDATSVRVQGGLSEIMRCIGTFKPVRLLPKFLGCFYGRRIASKHSRQVEVVSVEPKGVQDVVALATSTKTLMAEGLFSHNTQLVKHYPEVIKAAAQDDGLDISDALISRIVNRAQPNDVYGTPYLLRSFRTLMMEESLNAAQDAVADRLYAPLVLATLGIENMGDGEPWIPSPQDLDDLRDDIQAALAADFKLLCHNMGLQVQNVFGRESVPRFDQDYQRIEQKLLQAWGIGEALIAGGTNGTYASSALNREVCEQLMKSFQNQLIRHIRKRMEIIAEAQQHYDYETKGGYRRPLYRQIVDTDPETGEDIIRRVPKLLIPDIRFNSLNLRDESTERAFVAQLKAGGVPISDKTQMMNLPIDFAEELKRSVQESVQKWVATGESLAEAQRLCDEKKIPYPADLAEQLTSTLLLRQQKAQTGILEGQEDLQDQQIKQMQPAGQLGLLPGTVPMPPPEVEGDGQQKSAAIEPELPGIPHGEAPTADAPTTAGPYVPPKAEIPRNRGRVSPEQPGRTEGTGQRPAISDEQRKQQPKAASNGRSKQRVGKLTDGPRIPRTATAKNPPKPGRFSSGPSSLGSINRVSENEVEAAVKRLESIARHTPQTPRVEDLVADPEFYAALNAGAYEGQIQADFPEIVAGGAKDSQRILNDLLEQYADVFGTEPQW